MPLEIIYKNYIPNSNKYSFSRRGQLGDETMKMRRVPSIVEPLAGIKIVSISAGGWHSAAVSSFGDVYLWGFNSHGQLGIRLYKDTPSDSDPQKNPSVYPIPQLVEVTCSCSKQSKTSEEKSVDGEAESTSTESTKSSDDSSSTSESTDKKDDSSNSSESTEKKDEGEETENKVQEDIEMPLISDEKENQSEKEISNEKENNEVEIHLESSCNVVKAFCGARHTIIQMECGKFFAVGSNENGQLGLGLKDNLCDQFLEITAISNKKVVCGPWTTIFQDNK